ncbi:MAG: cytochrome c biogenesis CcdA family protein [Rubrobacteraceae bacterium]
MSEPTLLLAVVAGVVSFLSPCMLPVIPAFLAQLAGSSLGYADLRRRDLLSSTILFVAGFSVVFAVLGVLVNAVLQGAATEVVTWLSRIAGVIVIALGLHLTGLLRIPLLDRDYSIRPSALSSAWPVALKPGRLTSLLFGASFAVAWTPCVGPVLGSTLALAAASPASAFPLLLAYAFGLGIPFLLVGLFPGRAFAFIKRHRRGAYYVHLAFGFVLIGMGVLVFTNKLSLLANFQILNGVLL